MKRYVIRFDPETRWWLIFDKVNHCVIESGYSKYRAFHAACHYNHNWERGIPA
jgi:hypothetical protein